MFDLQASDVDEKWTPLLSQFCIENAKSIPNATDAQKQSFLPHLVDKMAEQDASAEMLLLGFSTLKIIARTRSSLEPIYDSKFAGVLYKVLSDSATSREAALEALRVIVNMCVLNYNKANAVLITAKVYMLYMGVHTRYNDREITHACIRCLFYVAVKSEIATELINDTTTPLFSTIIDIMVTESKNCQSMLAAKDADGQLHRELLSLCFKTLFNAQMYEQLPRLQDKVTLDELKGLRRVYQVVICEGIEITKANVNELSYVKDRLPNLQEIDAKHVLEEEPDWAAHIYNEKVNGEWKAPFFPEDADPDERTPGKKTLSALKHDAFILLIYMLPVFEEALFADLRGFKALLLDFHRNMLSNPKTQLDRMLPLLTLALKITKESNAGYILLKNHIFGEVAFKHITAKGKAGVQPSDMTEAEERDANPYSLRTILRKLLTTVNQQLKLVVSEFLYALCKEESGEFIRLMGFGNAVGYLTKKGLPGLDFLGNGEQQGGGSGGPAVVNLSDMAQAIRDEEAKGLTTEQAKEAIIQRLVNPIAAREERKAREAAQTKQQNDEEGNEKQ